MLGTRVRCLDGGTGTIVGESQDRTDWLVHCDRDSTHEWWSKTGCTTIVACAGPEEGDSVHGKTVFRTEDVVVRVTVLRFDHLRVVVHRVVNGTEEVPTEYSSGNNCLCF
jgi:hypothetical protein